jgi:hypothetical protein
MIDGYLERIWGTKKGRHREVGNDAGPTTAGLYARLELTVNVDGCAPVEYP